MDRDGKFDWACGQTYPEDKHVSTIINQNVKGYNQNVKGYNPRPADKKYNNLNMGILLWASGMMTDLGNRGFPKETDGIPSVPTTMYARVHQTQRTGLVANINGKEIPYVARGHEYGASAKEGGYLTGAVAYNWRVYIIEFWPTMNFMQWRRINPDEHELFKIPVDLEIPTKGGVPPGHIQSEFVSRVLEQLIVHSQWYKEWDIENFFNGYDLTPRAELVDIFIPELTYDYNVKFDLAYYVVCAALADTQYEWEEDEYRGDDESEENATKKRLILKGQPNLCFDGYPGCKHVFEVWHWTSTWKIEHVTDFGYQPRGMFWYIQQLFDGDELDSE